MNYTNSNHSGYYDDLQIEIAILQQTIKLPELPKEELSLEVLQKYTEEGKTYNLMQNCYDDMIGNFYIPILFPLVENGESTELIHNPPKSNNILNKTIKNSKYVERNFISLIIPKYIVMNFKDEIPKGTKFLIGFIGGGNSISDINIIGLYGHEL